MIDSHCLLSVLEPSYDFFSAWVIFRRSVHIHLLAGGRLLLVGKRVYGRG